MANINLTRGGYAEMVAHAMFAKRGFNVFTSIIPETYDMVVATEDADGKSLHTIQVKTIKYRRDREGQIVIMGCTSEGISYNSKVVDYILGVDTSLGIGYLVPNTEKREYWASTHESAKNKWIQLSL